MATQAASARKTPDPEGISSADELMRMLLRTLSNEGAETGAPGCGGEESREEVILDLDLDGARYLLVRLPLAQRPRVQLSPREQEIVRMVAQGHSNKIIADVLAISSWTVCTHLRRIFAKLGVGSRAAMVARLMEVASEHPRKAERPCPSPFNGHRRAS
jgi:DNA-binding CsgD family transcriptional regulator